MVPSLPPAASSAASCVKARLPTASRVPAQRAQLFTARQLPQLQRAGFLAHRQGLAVRRDGDGGDVARRARQAVLLLPARHIPGADRGLAAERDGGRPVGRQRHQAHRLANVDLLDGRDQLPPPQAASSSAVRSAGSLRMIYLRSTCPPCWSMRNSTNNLAGQSAATHHVLLVIVTAL